MHHKPTNAFYQKQKRNTYTYLLESVRKILIRKGYRKIKRNKSLEVRRHKSKKYSIATTGKNLFKTTIATATATARDQIYCLSCYALIFGRISKNTFYIKYYPEIYFYFFYFFLENYLVYQISFNKLPFDVYC